MKRETKDSTAAVLKVLCIYCNLNKNTLRERIFQHGQDMETVGLSIAVCFNTGTYFNSQSTCCLQEEVSFASQYRKAIPPRGLHRAGNRSPELGQSVTVHRGNWGRTQSVHSTRSLLQTRAQPLGGSTKVVIPAQGQQVLSLSLSRHLCRQTVGSNDANSTPNSL